MVVVVGQLVQEGARLQDEGGQHHFGQVHAWPQLLQESPDETLVLLGHGLHLRRLPGLENTSGHVEKHFRMHERHCEWFARLNSSCVSVTVFRKIKAIFLDFENCDFLPTNSALTSAISSVLCST